MLKKKCIYICMPLKCTKIGIDVDIYEFAFSNLTFITQKYV